MHGSDFYPGRSRRSRRRRAIAFPRTNETPVLRGKGIISDYPFPLSMNPVILGRVAKLGMTSVKSAGILLRKSMHYRGDLYTHLMSRRACNSMKNITRTTKRFMSVSAQPGTTNVWGASSGAETAALLIGASTVICGGIYYLSCSQQVWFSSFRLTRVENACLQRGREIALPLSRGW